MYLFLKGLAIIYLHFEKGRDIYVHGKKIERDREKREGHITAYR